MHAPEPVTATWGFPTKVWFGAGRLGDLPAAVRQCGATRPLLVTDRGLATLPMVAEAVALLADALQLTRGRLKGCTVGLPRS